MGKYKDLLIKFMTEKNRIVKQATGLLIATKPDMDELRVWSEYTCEYVISRLRYTSDTLCCPWCIIHLCRVCGYAERNGSCGTRHSRFMEITKRIDERTSSEQLHQLEGMKKLIKDTRGKSELMK